MARPRQPVAPAAQSTVSSGRARILLVEDDARVRTLLASRFRLAVEMVGFPTLRDAAKHESENWNGAIVDHHLPDGTGLALARRLVARGIGPVVLFTAVEPRDLHADAARGGVVYVHKTDGLPLLERMVETWRRLAAASEGPTSAARLERRLEECEARPRERDVARLAFSGLTRDEVAAALNIRPSTVRTHVNALLKRTGHRRLAQLFSELSSETPTRQLPRT